MKTIKTLQILINLLYYILLVVIVVGFLYYFTLFFFPEVLPNLLQMSRMAFQIFDWKVYSVLALTVANFILFTAGVYFLKKTIPFFKEGDFYATPVIKNLKKTGKLFLFIGISMILLKMLSPLIVSNFIGFNKWYIAIISLLSSIDIPMLALVIVGLFFLVFSHSFQYGKEIQEENNLTI